MVRTVIYTFAIFTIFLVLCAKVNAQNIIGNANIDKVLHTSLTYIESDVAREVFKIDDKTNFYVCLGTALAKEQYDVSQGGKFDWEDVGFGILGWVANQLVRNISILNKKE